MAQKNIIAKKNITQRKATLDDMIFANALFREVMKTYIEKTWSSETERETCYKRNERTNKNVQILEDDNRKIGYFIVAPSEDKFFLDHIHLIPAYQRCGIGKSIIQNIQSDAKRKNLPVELVVLRTNPAQRLYTKLGFVITNSDEYRHYMRWDA